MWIQILNVGLLNLDLIEIIWIDTSDNTINFRTPIRYEGDDMPYSIEFPSLEEAERVYADIMNKLGSHLEIINAGKETE